MKARAMTPNPHPPQPSAIPSRNTPDIEDTVILFDVMDTIVRDPFYTAMPAYFALSFEDLLDQKHPTAWIDFESNRLTEDEFFAMFFKDKRPIDKRDFIETVLLDQYEFLQGMESTLSKLSGRGYDMRTFSNYPIWYEYVEHVCGLSRYVEWEFVSCKGVLAERGARKPSLESFEVVRGEIQRCKDTGADLNKRIVFVDDREANVEAAERAGMEGVLFRGAAELETRLREMGIEV
jgi:FMN phosphatase YigB (HAD superfamily)